MSARTAALRTAVIGAGFVGSSHIEGIRRTGTAEVSALASSTLDRAREAAQRFHVERVGTWEDLVADPEIDVIHNCTPNALHVDIAAAALEAGKHLVTEKPLATSTSESGRLADLAARTSSVAAVCFNYRHYPMVQEARRLIATGAIGDVHTVHGSYLQDWLSVESARGWRLDPAQAGPSIAFADIGTHWCDLVSHLVGKRVTSVTASTRSLWGRSGDDRTGLLLELGADVFGALMVSQASPGRKNELRLQIDGTEGSVSWNQELAEQLWVGRHGRFSEYMVKSPRQLGEPVASLSHFPAGHPEGWNATFRNLFSAVYDAIASEEADPLYATIADGHYAVQLIEAVIESSATRARVEISSTSAPMTAADA